MLKIHNEWLLEFSRKRYFISDRISNISLERLIKLLYYPSWNFFLRFPGIPSFRLDIWSFLRWLSDWSSLRRSSMSSEYPTMWLSVVVIVDSSRMLKELLDRITQLHTFRSAISHNLMSLNWLNWFIVRKSSSLEWVS